MKSFIQFIVIGLFVLGMGCFSHAQSTIDSLSFQHIKTGMSQSSATQIFEDSEGFLWIGTPNGLNKYDGTNFQVFEKGEDGVSGLTDGYIESIYEDTTGLMYIGTNQGLNSYDRKLNTVTPYPFLPQGAFLQSKYIGAIARSKDLLWLGTDNNGVYRYHIPSGETKQIRFYEIYAEGPSNNYIVEVFSIDDDKLLIITQASVYIINNDLQIIAQLAKPQDISRAIQVSEEEYLLGSHDGELIRLNIQADYEMVIKNVTVTPGHTILALAQDTHGNVWVGSENAGLSIYTPKTGAIANLRHQSNRPNSISNNSIWSLYKASNGVMWLGPFKNGLSFYDANYHKFVHYKVDPFDTNSLSNNLVNTFIEADGDNLWVGTDGGGMNYWNRAKNTFEEFSLDNGKMHSNVVLSFLKDTDGKIWVGSWANGLCIMDQKNNTTTVWTKENSFLGSNNVTDLLQDRKGRIWIVTLFGGVHVYHPESGKHQHVNVRSEKDGSKTTTVARLLEDSQGQIWVGSQTSGLFKLVEKHNKWVPVHYHTLHEDRAISNDFINTMVEDQEGTLWIGTQAGLNKYQPESDSFLAITKKDGLPSDAIKGIVRDNEGYLWLSTGKGILRYHPEKGDIVDYDVDDGLQGNEFSAASVYQTDKGELLFGGSNGFNIFKPQHVKKRQDVPKTFISGLRIFNKAVAPNDDHGVLTKDIAQTDSLTLKYRQDVVGFEFNALTYRHSKKVNFAYFLEGFETEWNYVGTKRQATYTNLNPGTYTFRVKSTNSDGVWVDNETALVLTVTPPFWKTWWFRSAAVMLIVLIVWLLHSNRVTNLEKYQQTLEVKIAERTSELEIKHKKLLAAADELSQRNEEIQRFAFAVSHDLKSPLSSIKSIASLIPMEIEIKKNSDMDNYVTYIDETCDMMGNLIADITKIAKLGKIENKNTLLDTNKVLKLACGLVQGKLVERNVTLHMDRNLPKIIGDHNRMIQVFENLIDNAIKYMGEQQNPKIWVKTKKLGSRIQFMVIDNGSGMDKASLEKLFTPFERFDGSVEGSGLGLYMVKKIVESHGGAITGTSEGKGKGTTFILEFPMPEKVADKHRKTTA